jgi:hypothetical protein
MTEFHVRSAPTLALFFSAATAAALTHDTQAEVDRPGRES